ncbi:uncharacterized protein Z518_10111 [Rhinocladiella mackenziei CBS 650.93]|uniref:Zn(2)-C6 fungal-type domain-containing protein n=1 Tax=Rhinocladiella mackenziei CBS 650.93 TaxID=1442369 RepID=A0A0D2IWR0_9EURO|nr:uncharacterized protein Z518_10111 [Rhinocladiella mackenziei CBS 650.93]KIX01045.1 hypothetical protein Z518_10111 [Rhinocladiella mackenziei CBS 650.93]
MPARTKEGCTRTFTACWTCRRRRVRCDGQQPFCSECTRARVACDGYNVKLVWVEPETGNYQSRCRRTLDCASTWKGSRLLTSGEVDRFISECDFRNPDGKTVHVRKGPFSAFLAEPRRGDRPEAIEPMEPEQIAGNDDGNLVESEQDYADATSGFDLTVINLPRKPSGDLFHHYVQHVACLMIPVDDYRNPWKSTYPSIAVHGEGEASTSLYYALISQAAFNRSNLRTPEQYELRARDRALALNHYGRAVRGLRLCLAQSSQDFAQCIGTVMTLIMAEIWSEESRACRLHFQGAMSMVDKYLLLQRQRQPWANSYESWIITQSLALSSLLVQTASFHATRYQQDVVEALISSVSEREQFGFTVGATSCQLRSILRIYRMENQLRRNMVPEDLDSKVAELLNSLGRDAMQGSGGGGDEGNPNDFETMHYQLFSAAAEIYLYRVLFDIPPSKLQSKIATVLDMATRFIQFGAGYPTAWPVFIAAVEAATPELQHSASRWLDWLMSHGIGSRKDLKLVIEETWRRRREMAGKETGRGAIVVEEEGVSIDWRTVADDLDCEVILI